MHREMETKSKSLNASTSVLRPWKMTFFFLQTRINHGLHPGKPPGTNSLWDFNLWPNLLCLSTVCCLNVSLLKQVPAFFIPEMICREQLWVIISPYIPWCLKKQIFKNHYVLKALRPSCLFTAAQLNFSPEAGGITSYLLMWSRYGGKFRVVTLVMSPEKTFSHNIIKIT